MEIDKGLVCLSFLCIVQVFIEGMRENTLDIFRTLDLPQLEDELEPEIEKAPRKKRVRAKRWSCSAQVYLSAPTNAGVSASGIGPGT